MTKNTLTPDVVLEQAITLARQNSWESFSLTELASLLDCSLSDIKQFYRSKDDMAEAFFNRADDAMLNLTSTEEYRNLTSDDKLLECIMAWFESLAPYRPLVRELLAYKLEPGHFHLQAHGITRISRTVQWFIEVSDRKNTGLKRIADEVAVTSAYLASFSFFLFDNSEKHANTRALLKSLLRKINQGHQLFFTSAIAKPVPISRH
jgi:ubiquinone biosynthesis protein COQ9